MLIATFNDTEAQSKLEKSRTIVTTDGEIDDEDSFIRILPYTNEYHIEGLIYNSSMRHYKGDGNQIRSFLAYQ